MENLNPQISGAKKVFFSQLSIFLHTFYNDFRFYLLYIDLF